MIEKVKSKKPKRRLTRKEAIKKGNKEFRSFAKDLAKSMDINLEKNKIKK